MKAWSKKIKYAVRLLPCSMYDMERMASWLSDMAKKGYILSGILAGVALFKREAPQKLRYRLCELPYNTLLNDRSPSNEEELIAICEAGGWKYITKRRFFGIFAADNASVPELNTDLQLQYDKLLGYLGCLLLIAFMFLAMGFGFLQFNGLFIGAVAAILLFSFLKYGNKIPRSISLPIALLPLCTIWKIFFCYGFLITWINESSAVFIPEILRNLFFTVLIFYFFAGPVKFLLRIRQDKPFDYAKPWRCKAFFYRVTSVSIVVIFFSIFCSLLNSCAIQAPDPQLQPLETYAGTVPFATMETLLTGQPVAMAEWNNERKEIFQSIKVRTRDVPNVLYHWRDGGSHLEVKSDWIAPAVFYFQQEACILLPNGQQIQGSLSVTYYETRAPWLAKELMREYADFAREKLGEDYQPLVLPDLGVADALAYTDGSFSDFYPRLILQDGNCMMKVYFYQDNTGYVIPLEQWSRVFAEGLKSDGAV